MNELDAAFKGQGGLAIHRRRWLPQGAPRAGVVIAHGAGEHLGRYEHVAARLTAEGFCVHALDHRGHGTSEGLRADIVSIEDVAADLRTLIRIARSEQPDRKLFVLGHSLGGCISLAYTGRRQDEIDGLILSSPLAVLSEPTIIRSIAKLLGSVAPRLGVYGVDSSFVSRDPEVVRAYDEDPLVHHGKLPARTIAELTRAVESFPSMLPGLTLPLYVFQGSADRIADPGAAAFVHRLAGSRDKTIFVFDGLYHECMNEPEQDDVLGRIVDWIEPRA